jgi:CheY-like chemotaxis protein
MGQQTFFMTSQSLPGGNMKFTREEQFHAGFGHSMPRAALRISKGSSTELQNDDPSENSLKILIAEDDNISRFFLAKVLQKIGHQVKSVKNGKEVLDALHNEGPFDVLLTDIQMPEIDGIEVTRILRSEDKFKVHAHLPVIAMTAYGAKGDKEKYIKVGIDDYLPKPIDPKLLAFILQQIPSKLQ